VQEASQSSPTQDIALRLQQIISNWGGAARGEPLSNLHSQCLEAAGRGSPLLPAQVLFVVDLDLTRLRAAIRRSNGLGRNAAVEFRVSPSGRFDAALVPVGRAGTLPDRFVLALDPQLSLQDQVALYGHAVGHLLLNYQEQQMGQRPFLDPRNGFAHADTLAELRLLEAVRQLVDRRVLETFPLLTRLLEPPEESRADFDAATLGLRELLHAAGWKWPLVEMRYQLTAGRVYPSAMRRGARLYVDALLRASQSLPIAVVHAMRADETRADALRRLHSSAQRLAVPFAYLLDEQGMIQEFDWSASPEPISATLSAFPARDALWERWTAALQLTDPRDLRALLHPYDIRGSRTPRYYQEAAINRAVIAVLQARHRLRPPRILLTLATGTGKTQVAFQLLWKLKREQAVRNILFLTDRDFLLTQAMDNEFASFGDGRYRIQGEFSSAYDINFATYQAITTPDAYGRIRYLNYPADFFQVIVVDECHRGSAREDSAWRRVLEHFSGAIHIGLTATPLSTETVQTDQYFGEPLYSYSLRMGINDGYLAPYRVRRVLIGQAAEEEPLTTPGEERNEAQQETIQVSLDGDEASVIDIPLSMETPGTMIAYTKPIAQHLAAFLQRTDPLAKTIVFCVDQAHAESMRAELAEACASFAPRRADYVVRIVSDEGPEGRRALGNFSTPDEPFPVIVTTSKLLGTGVDVPTCKNIALARPVGSIVEFKQMIGRGTRLFEPQKRWFTILDYAGTIKHFFDPDFDGDPELAEKETLVAEPAEQEGTQPAGEATPAGAGEPAPTSEPAPSALPAEEGQASADAPQQDALAGESPSPEQPVSPGPSQELHEQDEQSPPVEVCACQGSTPEAAPPHRANDSADGQGASDVSAAAGPEPAMPAPPPPTPEAAPAGQPEPEAIDPANPPPGVRVVTTPGGSRYAVIGEIVYELGADGRTLRRGSYREQTVSTIRNLLSSAQDLRARWLIDAQREGILEKLGEEGVDLGELAYSLHLMDVDPLDLLLHVVFGEPVITRAERVERLRREHAAFFKRYENNLLARAVLDVILDKYIRGEAPDVSDVDLLQVISLADRHTPYELARPFSDPATNRTVHTVLKELQTLLYNV
jgi:type I restriction enzyme R subunit